ncbi:MAG: hypothetical protein LBS50_08860 [Prevotellaceae bacterium]|jgi:hypothetical protein|nr:hypothetical protein [Prevotellaceae bacterium]
MKILDSISYWFFLREKSRKNEVSQNRTFMNYTEIKSVLLLVKIHYDSDIFAFENILQTLKKDGKKVILCCFVEQKKSLLQTGINRFIIKKENLLFWQKPDNEMLKEISAQEFDAVFDLTQIKSIPLLYVLLNANAKFRCGNNKQDGLHDFIIDVSNLKKADEHYLFEQITRYLKSINVNRTQHLR